MVVALLVACTFLVTWGNAQCNHPLMYLQDGKCYCRDSEMMPINDNQACVCKDSGAIISEGSCKCVDPLMKKNDKGLCECPEDMDLVNYSCAEEYDPYFCEHTSCKVLFSTTTLGISMFILYVAIIYLNDPERKARKEELEESMDGNSAEKLGKESPDIPPDCKNEHPITPS